MPELPEVETIVRGLRPSLVGQRIVAIRLGKTDFIDDPTGLASKLPGSEIIGVERLGKFIRIALSVPTTDATHSGRLDWFVHLGMTGQLRMHMASDPVVRHTHGFFVLDGGRELRYVDIRRFGRMLVAAEPESNAFQSRLGTEPLELSLEAFCERFGSRRARIKSMLLDQTVLRGVGNIYADESLFHAGIHPARIAGNLTREQLVALHRAVREVLETAIQLRGSSVSDYVDAEGKRGKFQQCHQVYQRTGEPCLKCGKPIRRVIVAGRSSHFCPQCQPIPRARKARRTAVPREKKTKERQVCKHASSG